MYLNFKFGSGRRCLRIENGRAWMDKWTWNTGWIGFQPISMALAERFTHHPEIQKLFKNCATWSAWSHAAGIALKSLELVKITRFASAVCAAAA